MYEITKEHRFEAAHRLIKGYPGNCRHLPPEEKEVDPNKVNNIRELIQRMGKI
jgi:hypothetical protein